MPRKQRRKPGAQPGNQNARKHGYYSNAPSRQLLAYHRAARKIKGLDVEIEFLRAKIASIQAYQPGNYPLLLTAASTLERLVRTQIVLDASARATVRDNKTVEQIVARTTQHRRRRKAVQNDSSVIPRISDSSRFAI